jgi:hypothetical protein
MKMVLCTQAILIGSVIRLKENNQSPPPSFDIEQFKTEQRQRWG